MSDDTTVCIYTLSDPDTGEVRYVGKTLKPSKRLSQHLWSAKAAKQKSHLHAWIVSLVRRGAKPVMMVVEETTIDNWKGRERYWIINHRTKGCRLVNLCDGGQGPTNYKMSPEARERYLSAIRTGTGRLNRLRSHQTPEHRNLMRHMKHKLTDEQASGIVAELTDPCNSFRDIATRFDTVEWIVSGIANGQTYLHIPRPGSIPPRARPYGLRYKLSSGQVQEIRRRVLAGEYRIDVAKAMGVSRKLVGLVMDGRAYADVSDIEEQL